MVDEENHQQDPRSGYIKLGDLVAEWMKATRPDVENWRIGRTLYGEAITMDAYGWWFSIYSDYMTSGIGQDRDGNRYDTGFMIEASDPEFFNKLKAKLDGLATTWPERQAEILKAARAAIHRKNLPPDGLIPE